MGYRRSVCNVSSLWSMLIEFADADFATALALWRICFQISLAKMSQRKKRKIQMRLALFMHKRLIPKYCFKNGDMEILYEVLPRYLYKPAWTFGQQQPRSGKRLPSALQRLLYKRQNTNDENLSESPSLRSALRKIGKNGKQNGQRRKEKRDDTHTLISCINNRKLMLRSRNCSEKARIVGSYRIQSCRQCQKTVESER